MDRIVIVDSVAAFPKSTAVVVEERSNIGAAGRSDVIHSEGTGREVQKIVNLIP